MVAGSKKPWATRLDEAQRLERQGELERAGDCYQGIVTSFPRCGEAWFGLGVLAMRIGDLELAATFLEQANAVGLSDPAVLINLGEAYRKLGRSELAVEVLQSVCRNDRRSRDGRINLGAALASEKRFVDALSALDEAIALDQQCNKAWQLKGEVLKNLGRFGEAIDAFRRVIDSDRGSTDALLGLAECLRLQHDFPEAIDAFEALLKIDARHQGALTGLAAIALEQKDMVSAAAMYEKVLELVPDYWEALFGLGVTRLRQQSFEVAKDLFERAIAVDPERSDALLQMAETLFQMDRYLEAKQSYEDCLKKDPNSVSSKLGIGNALLHLERLDEAIAQYKEVEAILPDEFRVLANLALAYQEVGDFELAYQYGSRAVALGMDEDDRDLAEQNLAQICLRQGKLDEGWLHYQFRRSNKRSFPIPEWQGEPLAGKRLLVWQDQGLGDVVLFGTMYRELIAQAGEVVIECERKLLPLVRRSFPEAIVLPRLRGKAHPLSVQNVDFHIAGGSLPRLLRPTIASFPEPSQAILRVDSERAAYWRQTFDALGEGKKIGICWRSMLSKGRRDLCYSDLSEWEPIFSLPSVHLVNLQYDQCETELEQAAITFGKTVVNFQQVDMFDDIDETTALISQLDLVISAPTLVARLAAGVGVPTFLATSFFDWTQFNCERDPWSASMRRFVRRWDQSWSEIFPQVAEVVKDRFKDGV